MSDEPLTGAEIQPPEPEPEETLESLSKKIDKLQVDLDRVLQEIKEARQLLQGR